MYRLAERIPGARRRMLSTRISLSKKVSQVSWAAEAIYDRIIPHADDAGRITADPEEFRATVIPLGKKGKQIPLPQIRSWLEELHYAGLVVLYSSDGADFLEVVKFEDFQTFKSDRPLSLVCPEPTEDSIWNPSESKGIPRLGSSSSSSLKNKSSPVSREYTPSFEVFWNIYPRKEGKVRAFELWLGLLAAGLTEEQLIESAERYAEAKNGTESEFLLLPATFLGPQRRFEDYFPAPPIDPAIQIGRLRKELETLRRQKDGIICGRDAKQLDTGEIERANEMTIKMRAVKQELEQLEVPLERQAQT